MFRKIPMSTTLAEVEFAPLLGPSTSGKIQIAPSARFDRALLFFSIVSELSLPGCISVNSVSLSCAQCLSAKRALFVDTHHIVFCDVVLFLSIKFDPEQRRASFLRSFEHRPGLLSRVYLQFPWDTRTSESTHRKTNNGMLLFLMQCSRFIIRW